ncbi:phosphomevalonate kinase isoform X2 [Phyllopteryx taeniolatus]|uniref:phosphomevalonate kinase isoform X2 n=1 Tax=Phyllopteryx taeniolatus TaxID=161469 RepID=UPI002AD1DACF|nr:phosphomevalonate kinase isoform X2 [Phyllopteryx taeniolatus]
MNTKDVTRPRPINSYFEVPPVSSDASPEVGREAETDELTDQRTVVICVMDSSAGMDPSDPKQSLRSEPKLVLIFSGKRKSGKDYVTDIVLDRLGEDVCAVVRLSAPLKQAYAQEHCLDLEQLLGCGVYKEVYRADMIRWGEARRRQDPGFFCRLATRGARRPIWVVSDARRMSDLQWFWAKFPRQTRCVRVESREETRRRRGWSFTAGVDDAESECGLDSGVDFHWTITNEADAPSLEDQLRPIIALAAEAASH